MRRVQISVLAAIVTLLCWAKTPESELQLKIVRDQGLPETLQIGDCLPGTMYISSPETPLTGAGDVQIGATLELPWRANQNEISAIPVGSYSGHVREDGPKGWRIELEDVKGRPNVQIHLGNWPKDSTGCILLGDTISDKKACLVEKSGDSMKKLQDLYASPNHTRSIRVTVVNQ
jgi:hypothetical protein